VLGEHNYGVAGSLVSQPRPEFFRDRRCKRRVARDRRVGADRYLSPSSQTGLATSNHMASECTYVRSLGPSGLWLKLSRVLVWRSSVWRFELLRLLHPREPVPA